MTINETEADIHANCINPMLRDAGWGVVPGSQMARELTIALRRILGRGQRGRTLSTDYVLSFREHQLAVQIQIQPDSALAQKARVPARVLVRKVTR